jgi:hypothetical protein
MDLSCVLPRGSQAERSIPFFAGWKTLAGWKVNGRSRKCTSPRGRPRRRYYRLSKDGAVGARTALQAAKAGRLKAVARLRTAGA